jgi:tetratricopeptide (TPR) repeat protein
MTGWLRALATAPSGKARRGLPLVVLACVAVFGGRDVAAKAGFGDFVRASKAMSEWRYDDARAHLAALQKAAPDEPETRYLVAEMAFLDGEYERAAKMLEKLKDSRVKQPVSELRPLVESTLAATAGFATRDSPGGHFTFSYTPGKDELLVDLAAEALELAYQEIGADVGWFPSDKVRVEILPRTADLARVSTLTQKEIETSGTIALCKYNKLMIVSPRATLFGYPWMDTLAHEYAHYVITRATADRVPIWLHEGLAKFEETRWREAGGAQKLGRLSEHLLAVALKKGRLISFEEMHPSMAKLPSQEAAATAFAEVYTMVAWMHGEVGYDGLRQVLAKIKDGKSERRAIAEVLGGTWEDVEKRWKKHLKAMRLEPADKKPITRKLRFDKSKDTGENVGIEEIPEDKARKLARIGGLLRARGRLGAAAIEYEKARALVPDDHFVAHKLARTYLELGEHKKAIEIAAPLVARDDEDAGPQATLGAAYLAAGEAAKARQHLWAAVRVSPFDPAVRCGLAEVFTGEGDRARAEREQLACDKLRE